MVHAEAGRLRHSHPGSSARGPLSPHADRIEYTSFGYLQCATMSAGGIPSAQSAKCSECQPASCAAWQSRAQCAQVQLPAPVTQLSTSQLHTVSCPRCICELSHVVKYKESITVTTMSHICHEDICIFQQHVESLHVRRFLPELDNTKSCNESRTKAALLK